MKSTQKEEALTRLAAIESEAQELRAIIEEPDVRTPEAGDVHDYLGEEILLTSDGRNAILQRGHSGRLSHKECQSYTYLGKHHEVYVKISDVRDALSIDDVWGDNVLINTGAVFDTTFAKSKAALAKLGIK